MEEAEQSNPYSYKHFNAFFTRLLKLGSRPIDPSPTTIISPVDGVISDMGLIAEETLIQAKGAALSLNALLGGDADHAALFNQGHFITLYLAPKDYHRVHMPKSGRLKKMVHAPGQLFSVNPLTISHIPDVLTRNERLILLFETDEGPMTVVMVGAMIVASLATPWTGVITSSQTKQLRTWDYESQPLFFQKGEEIGHFELGSTVIILCSHNAPDWRSTIQQDNEIKMGQALT